MVKRVGKWHGWDGIWGGEDWAHPQDGFELCILLRSEFKKESRKELVLKPV
jgi:hypothetical protein